MSDDLDHLLAHAADGEAARERFLAALLDATIYLALFPRSGRIIAGPDGQATVPSGDELELKPFVANGRRFMPLFTAPDHAPAFAQADHVVAPDGARALLERHPGVDFAINPGSALSLTLFAAEAAALLTRGA